jgi:hypothetical protein
MAYKTQSMDTTEAAERYLFANLRRKSPGARLAMMQRLSSMQLNLAWSGLKRANPHLTQRELQVKAVRLWYGEDDARRLEAELKKRGLWN